MDEITIFGMTASSTARKLELFTGAWCNGTIMADNQRNAALIYNGAVRTDLQIGLSDKTGKFYPTAKYIYDFVSLLDSSKLKHI